MVDQNRLVVARGWALEEMRDVGQRVQVFTYEANKFCRSNDDYS